MGAISYYFGPLFRKLYKMKKKLDQGVSHPPCVNANRYYLHTKLMTTQCPLKFTFNLPGMFQRKHKVEQNMGTMCYYFVLLLLDHFLGSSFRNAFRCRIQVKQLIKREPKAEKFQSRLTNKFQSSFTSCTDLFLLRKLKTMGTIISPLNKAKNDIISSLEINNINTQYSYLAPT